MTFGIASSYNMRRPYGSSSSSSKRPMMGPGPLAMRPRRPLPLRRPMPPTADYEERPLTHAELGLREVRRPRGAACEQQPNQEARLKQRIKQVAIGKATQGYVNYLQAVPKEARVPGVNLDTPSTSPRAVVSMSKRQFHGELKAWRKYLHHFDDISETVDTTSQDGPGSSDSDEAATADFPTDPSSVAAEEHSMAHGTLPMEDGAVEFYPEEQYLYDDFAQCYEQGEYDYSQYPMEEYPVEPYSDYDNEYAMYDYEGSMNCMPGEMMQDGEHFERYPEEPLYDEPEQRRAPAIYQDLPPEGFPTDPSQVDYRCASQPPPLHDMSYTSLAEGTPMTNIEALEAQLIAYN